MKRVFAALLAGVVCTGVLAQTAKPPAAQAPAPAPEKPEPPAAPYETQLLRLAEIMGALAYLQDLCGDARLGEDMRNRMLALIDAEATTAARKGRFAGAYNRGFRGFELTYRTCTGNARIVVERYLAEGQSIAREVASRYGGG